MTDTVTVPLSAAPCELPFEMQRIGKYVVVAKIGSGGQCDVYRAVHPELAGEVAIKIGRPSLSSDPVSMENLRREGRILSELRHPNLARVYDLDVHDGCPFLVLEYVRGLNLFQYAQQSHLAPQRAAQIIADVARALAVVHRAGMVHGDCKPNNIVMDEENQPRLIDFGLSWRSDAWTGSESSTSDAISGTLAFMSPEQVAGKNASIDSRADIFNLGGTLFYLLTGRPPYPNGELKQTLQRLRSCQWDRETLDQADAPTALKKICRRAMAANPEKRFASMGDMADELEKFSHESGYGRRSLLIACGFAAILALGFWGYSLIGEPKPVQTPGASVDPQALPINLRVDVWQEERRFELVNGVPLQNGDALQIQWTLPAGMYGSLFLLNSDQTWRRLATYEAGESSQTLRFPESATAVAPVSGVAGTEFLLACASKTAAMTVAEIESAAQSLDLLPQLGDASVLRVDPKGVSVEQRSRDLLPAVELVAPEMVVTQQLEKLREQLVKNGILFEGVAFAHAD